MKSEFDYSIKRKFVDIISKQKPKQLTSEALGGENKTVIDDKVSMISRKINLSIRSGRRDNLAQKIQEGITTNVEPIVEE